MIRKIILVSVLGILSMSLQAQYLFDKGNIAVNAGVGFFSLDGVAPSLNVSSEYGLFPTGEVGVIAVGGAMEYKYSLIRGQGYNQVTIGPRITWHMQIPFFEKINFDFYSGLGAGYNSTTTGFDRKLSAYMEYFVGSRLKLNSDLSLFAEFGDGAIASVKVGFVYHINSSIQKRSVVIPGSKNKYFLIKK